MREGAPITIADSQEVAARLRDLADFVEKYGFASLDVEMTVDSDGPAGIEITVGVDLTKDFTELCDWDVFGEGDSDEDK